MKPPLGRLVARDPLARLAAFFFLLGLAAIAAFVRAASRPPVEDPAQRAISVLEGRPAPPPTPWDDPPWMFLLVGACVVALPARLWSLRSFFARAETVEGVISDVPRTHTRISLRLIGSSTATVVRYRYQYGGRQLEGEHHFPLGRWRKWVDRVGGPVALLVDPRDPRRATLEEAWQA